MRVLHVPYSFYPDPAGGTEVYVDSLATWQRSSGCLAAIAAPGGKETRYDRAGIPVWRFPVSPKLSLRDLYGEGDEVAAKAFGRILDDFNPDIVHLHAITSAISIRIVEKAADRGIPVILNYHTPTVSCSRGTLLRWGSAICDGKVNRQACTACTLQGQGVALPLANLIASLPASATRRLGPNLSGGMWTALRMPELIEVRIAAFHRLMQMVDRVIALCDWTRDLLIGNGVPENKITLCRQGISWQSEKASIPAPRSFGLPLRAAFLGRFDVTKGIHILVQALSRDGALPVHLDLFGIQQGATGNRYSAELEAMIAGDPRIRILPPLASDEVVPRLRDYDLALVPSQWLETGPLVVLEAFAAGIPVVGSNLGGIAELVTDGVDGILVDPASSSAAWTDSLRRICSDSGLLASLRAGIRPPRHTRQAVAEIRSLYEDVLRNAATLV